MAGQLFFVTGDEWGLVDIVPAENRAQFERARAARAEHHRHTEFGPMGWETPPFLIPAPEVPLSVRAIPLTRLGEGLDAALTRADGVQTCEDFTGAPFEARGCFAWAELPDFRAGVYGKEGGGVVQSLYVADPWFRPEVAARVADGLAALGAAYRLLLVAHGHILIDLADRDRLERFLSGADAGDSR